MATITAIDYRKRDQYRHIHHPYWIFSGEISAVASDDKGAIAFSFPEAQFGNSIIMVEKVAFQVTEVFAGGTITVNVGLGTLALDANGDGDDITIVDLDEFIPTANITSGTLGTYFAATGDWITAKLLMTEAAPCIITPADAAVPVVYVSIASDATITAGKGRVVMQITEVPVI